MTLSEVSMESEGGVTADELKMLLGSISEAHQKLADSLNALNVPEWETCPQYRWKMWRHK